MDMRSLLFLVAVAAKSDFRPTIGVGNKTCDQNPEIVSYHIHFTWDAEQVPLSRLAKNTSEAFAAAMQSTGLCPFSHAFAAPDYAQVCHFPFDWSTVEQPRCDNKHLINTEGEPSVTDQWAGCCENGCSLTHWSLI